MSRKSVLLKYFRILNDIWIKITHIFTLLSTVFIIWYMSVLNTKPSYKTKANNKHYLPSWFLTILFYFYLTDPVYPAAYVDL